MVTKTADFTLIPETLIAIKPNRDFSFLNFYTWIPQLFPKLIHFRMVADYK